MSKNFQPAQSLTKMFKINHCTAVINDDSDEDQENSELVRCEGTHDNKASRFVRGEGTHDNKAPRYVRGEGTHDNKATRFVRGGGLTIIKHPVKRSLRSYWNLLVVNSGHYYLDRATTNVYKGNITYDVFTIEIPYNEKLEHRKPLCIEREGDPLHILLVAMRCYAHYMMRIVSLSVMPCE